MKVAVVGATGLVGDVMLKVLEEQQFPVTELLPVASQKSVGKPMPFRERPHTILDVEDAIARKPDIAIFSAGSEASKKWAPRFADIGTTVIDNSSAWRMDPNVPLIVPEVNADVLKPEHRIIANPNCSTIQMVVALQPLHQAYGIKRLVISTYQSVTGSGRKGIDQLGNEQAGGEVIDPAYPHPIHDNVIPHGGDFDNEGYTSEEMKLVHETRKIMGDESLQITATVARVPVHGGHSESVNVEFHNDYDLQELRELLLQAQGIQLLDDVSHFSYPMPRFAEGRDEVFVGRLRRDQSQPNSLNMWIVADNLRKGAATNAVQIAQLVQHLRMQHA